MQTKKKMPGRNSGREHANPRVSRSQKASETVQIREQKVTEIIASSARKQRFGKLKPYSIGLGYGCEEVSLSSLPFLYWYWILMRNPCFQNVSKGVKNNLMLFLSLIMMMMVIVIVIMFVHMVI